MPRQGNSRRTAGLRANWEPKFKRSRRAVQAQIMLERCTWNYSKDRKPLEARLVATQQDPAVKLLIDMIVDGDEPISWVTYLNQAREQGL